jgi:hypothetical protein
LQGLVRRSPLWILVLVIATAYAALQLGIRLLRGKEAGPEDVAIYGAFGVAMGIFTLWMAVRAARRERKLPPGSPTATNIQRAMATGQLPEHASAELWEPELIAILVQERRWAWIASVFFGLATVLGVFIIFDGSESPWLGVVCSVAFLGLAVGFPLWVRHRRPRIQKLLDQFPEEESIWRWQERPLETPAVGHASSLRGRFECPHRHIMAIQIPPERIGITPYVFALSGLGLMFGGYYTGKRKDWN